MLTTPQAVINRAGVASHPEYEDVSPITDGAGFYTFRRYPVNTQLSQIVTADGRPAVRCYLAFVMVPPEKGSHVSRVELRAWFARRWREGRVFASSGDPYEPPPGHPDAPSTQSRVILAHARLPLDLDSTDANDFLYDDREDSFVDEQGRSVTPIQMIEDMYSKHCRTLGRTFRIRWSIGSAVRWTIRQAVWKSHATAMWTLFKFYDVELVDEKKGKSFLNKYSRDDFRRVTDKPGERSHFFGFQTSQKSLFTNLGVVVAGCLILYWKAPHDGLLRAIYNNTALTTAALVFGFLLADTVCPWLLITTICGLSRLRDFVLFFVRKVNV